MSRRKAAKENNRGAGDAGGLFDLVEDVTIRGEAVEGESHQEEEIRKEVDRMELPVEPVLSAPELSSDLPTQKSQTHLSRVDKDLSLRPLDVVSPGRLEDKEFITGGAVDKLQERLRDRELRQAAVCLEAGSDAEVGHPPTMARTHAGESAQEGGEEVFPEAAELRPQAGMDNVSTLIPLTGGKKQRTTVHVSIEVMERIRNAVYWTPGLTLAAVAEEAFRKALVELEGQRGGVPFASRPTGLKGGRPLK